MTAAALLQAVLGAAAPRPAQAVTLRSGATLRLEPGRAEVVVRVERGTVLLTQAGDPLDHVLEPGQAFTARGAGRVVAWAFSDAALTVERRRARSRRAPRLAPPARAPRSRGARPSTASR